MHTLADILHGLQQSTKGITFINGSDREEFVSYSKLYLETMSALGYLQECGVYRSDEVVFQIEDNRTFIVLFWACILGGMRPVPLSVGKADDQRAKIFNVWPVLNNPYLVTSRQNLERIRDFSDRQNLREVFCQISPRSLMMENITTSKSIGVPVQATDSDIAYIQFSSGSTGDPKGVILSHKNIVTNCRAILKGIQSPPDGDLFLSWMPLTHDMGLIGFHLTPMMAGWNHFIMSTELFIRRPLSWLRKIEVNKVTFTASPNFGYSYLLNRHGSQELEGIDLSSLRTITNGAEPISAGLCERFVNTLSVCKLKSNVIFPVYGLAEASLAVTFSEMGTPVRSISLNRLHLQIGDKIRIEQSDGVKLVCVGKTIQDCSIQVTNSEGVVLPDGTIGHLQIKGDNVTRGYYNNDQETGKVITQDGWLRTGDTGFVFNDNLYVIGRAKDIIFVNGRNVYPHDIEKSVENIPGLETGRLAVAAYFDHESQQERILAFVLHKGGPDEFHQLAASLKSHVNKVFAFSFHDVVPVREIPKTTSGKVQRYKLIDRYGEDLRVNEHTSGNSPSKEVQSNSGGSTDPVEQKVLAIWRKVLKNQNISVDTNFFEAGGNSLKAAELIFDLQSELSVEVPMEDLFDCCTIRRLSKKQGGFRQTDLLSIKSSLRDRQYYKLSPVQSRMYYLWASDRLSLAYNVPVVLDLRGPLDVDRLVTCISKTVDAHDILRARFVMLDDEPLQTFSDSNGFAAKRYLATNGLVYSDIVSTMAPFDLGIENPFRVSISTVSASHHVVFLEFHHIVIDGISVANFMDEVMRRYQGLTIETRLQYRDFVEWASGTNGRQLQVQSEYWSGNASMEFPRLELAVDYPRRAIFDHAGKKIYATLPLELCERLRALVITESTTVPLVMLAAFFVTLSKYAGQEKFAVGLTVSGRTHPQLMDILGMFANSLPIVGCPARTLSFEEFTIGLAATYKKALNNQSFSLERLVEALEIPRDVSRNVLFDTMFTYQNVERISKRYAELNVEYVPVDPGFSKYDLSLEILDKGRDIEIGFEYATALFGENTIRRFSNHYQKVLHLIVDNPQVKLADIVLMDDEDAHKYLHQFNQTTAPFRDQSSVQELFAAQVKKTPRAIAVSGADGELTFQELDELSSKIARILLACNVQVGIPVALLLDRTLALIACMLGVLKAGTCYLPLDIELPVERVRSILADSKSNLCITSGGIMADQNIASIGDLTVVALVDELMNTAGSEESIDRVNGPHDLAYVIYTSGTTGTPKGVMIDHRALINYSDWAIRTYFRPGEIEFVPLFTSISFDLTITSIFPPLLSGNTILTFQHDDNDLAISKVIRDGRSTIIKCTPSHLKAARDVFEQMQSLSNINCVIVGGESFETHICSWLAKCLNRRSKIFNEYGPTEATVGCMIYEAGRDSLERTAVPIGKPINNMRCYILDDSLKPVPPGANGELYVAGVGLSKGYLNNQKSTSNVFIADVVSKTGLMYKTGDRARFISEQTIEYLGRFDHQVKISGHRIELSEVERCLNSSGLIRESVVLVKKNKTGDNFIVSYYCAGKEVLSKILRNYLLERLPSYMVPASFIWLREIPLTPNGKVDHKRLNALTIEAHGNAQIEVDDPFQLKVLSVWADVLKEKDLSVTDNFFEFGGDSIKAVQIAARLFNQGIDIRAKEILKYQTVEEVSVRHQPSKNNTFVSDDVQRGEKGLIPIDCWFFSQQFQEIHYYNQSVVLQLKKNLEVAVLETAFANVIQHHDGLRLNINKENATLFYNDSLIAKSFSIDLCQVSGLPANLRQSKIESTIRSVKGSIDVFGGFPFRVVLIEDELPLLLITVHHIAIDGVSWGILLNDFYACCHAIQNGENILLPRKTNPQQALCVEIEKLLQSDEVDREFWSDMENSSFGLPLDFDAPVWFHEFAETESIVLDKVSTQDLIAAQNPHTADTLTVITTALTRALYNWTGFNEITLEMEHNGRSCFDTDVSRTIGWFTSIYPLKFRLNGNGSLKDQLKSIRRQMNSISDGGRDYGICNYFPRPRITPPRRSEVRLNYLGVFESEVNNDLFSIANRYQLQDIGPKNQMTCAVEVNCMVINDALCVDVTYNTTAHRKETVQKLLIDFQNNLKEILDILKGQLHAEAPYLESIELDDDDRKILLS